MINRRSFILGLLSLLGFILLPFHFVISKKKKITVFFIGNNSPVEMKEPNCTYREAIIKSGALLKSRHGTGMIIVKNGEKSKTIYWQDFNKGITKDTISTVDVPKLDWKIEDGDHIILYGCVLGDGVPTEEHLRKERINGEVSLVRGKDGWFHEIFILDGYVLERKPGEFIRVSDFKLSNGLWVLSYHCKNSGKKFKVPTDYKYPKVLISKKDFELLPGWRREIFS